jgi:hypothetical protein
VFKLSDGGGLQLQVASDRSGVPVVMWTDRSTGQINSVYWNAGATQWVPLEVLDGTGNFLIDPDGSGHPLVRWNAPPPTGTTSFDKTVRRFDPVSGAWGPLVTLPGPPSLANAWQLAIDGAGNTHAFWRETTSASYWSWWRAGSASWEAAVPFDEVYSLVVVPAATFMWYERNELGVRRFDAQAGAWSDLVQLADLTKESDIRVHLLAVGRDGAPLMVSYRRDPTALAIEAWHGQPGTNAWGTRELVESIPQTTDPNQLTGPIGAFADPAHDFFWVPATAADGTFETHVERFDPVQGTWALSRVLHSTIENPRVDLQTDSAGRAYGYVNDGTLMRMDPAAPTWQDTAGGVGSGILRTSDNGAFLVGYINGDEVGALRSDAGGEWRPARGYPGGAHADVGSVPFGMAIAGPERAILVWTTYYGPDTGVWAAFLE